MKISLGSGGVRLAGWIHIDFDACCRPDIRADLRADLPFETACADFLHSEDFIGQLTFSQARHFLTECHRILKPGGVLRILTPDLEKLVSLYQKRDQHLKDLWDQEVGIPLVVGTMGELVHAALTFAEQNSFFDEETLRALLEPIGFTVHRREFGQSPFPELRNIDLRTPDNAISLYLDCEHKPV